MLLSLVAVGAAGYVGWQQWQRAQTEAADAKGVASLEQRVNTLESTLSGIRGERDSLNQRLSDAAAVNRSLREELLGQAQRTRNLEDAVAKLAEKSLSGHDTMLLNETESLLRMARRALPSVPRCAGCRGGLCAGRPDPGGGQRQRLYRPAPEYRRRA